MTGLLTLKRRFLEENFGFASLSFQKLQFLYILNFWKFRSVTSFSQQSTIIRDIFQLYWWPTDKCQAKSNELKFQESFSLPVLIRILRRFRFFCTYKRPSGYSLLVGIVRGLKARARGLESRAGSKFFNVCRNRGDSKISRREFIDSEMYDNFLLIHSEHNRKLFLFLKLFLFTNVPLLTFL